MLGSSSTINRLGMATPSGERQPERERDAAARRRVHVDRAAVIADDALDDRESEPAAVRLGGEAGNEELRALFRREPRAVVGDDDLRALVASLRTHGDVTRG